MEITNWPGLIDDLKEYFSFSDYELAQKCQVTESTVVSWKNAKSLPIVACKQILTDLILEAGLKLELYKSSSITGIPNDVFELIATLSELATNERNTIIDACEDLMEDIREGSRAAVH